MKYQHPLKTMLYFLSLCGSVQSANVSSHERERGGGGEGTDEKSVFRWYHGDTKEKHISTIFTCTF